MLLLFLNWHHPLVVPPPPTREHPSMSSVNFLLVLALLGIFCVKIGYIVLDSSFPIVIAIPTLVAFVI